MSYQKIIVALDHNSDAELIFPEALEIAYNQGSKLLLLHIANWFKEEETDTFLGIGTLGDVDMYRNFRRLHHENLPKDLEQIHIWLNNFCQQAQAKNLETEIDYRFGEPGSLICEQARNWGADLIIIGRRGYKGLSEFVLGSVSNYVLHHAPCSVLVVQGIKNSSLKSET